ncbi:MAG: Hpt domain-containing protein [Azoarcus sp.]|jgi:chemosensory pili system protein ChpA (sensor histidine kinase/response regulator)|nr:Hpt domain-containing protein [Azoarcus sp.]
MTQANEPDLGPLTWVKSEIDQALARANESLRETGQGGVDKVRFAQTHLHQVHGALSIIGLDGLTTFASAVELLFGALVRGEVALDEAVIKLGHRALASIGNYLDELTHGAPNLPLRLAPLYRELVLARGEPEPSAADLFFPDLGVRMRTPPRDKVPQLSKAARQQQHKTLRSHFQRGLLDWLRHPTTGQDIMRSALAGVDAIEESPAMRALWWAAQAFIDTLSTLPPAELPATKRLLSRLEAQLRHIDSGPSALPERLLRDLLYCVAIHPASTPVQQAVHKAWQLDTLIPESGSTVSDLPLAPLIQDLHTRLNGIKEQWNTFGEHGPSALSEFADRLVAFVKSASIIGRPLLDRLLGGMGRFVQWLARNPQRYSEPIALEFATAVLLVEASLDRSLLDPGFKSQVSDALARLEALARGEQISSTPSAAGVESARKRQEKEALAQVSHEILSSLANIEQTLDDFFRDQQKRAPLAQLAEPLRQIEGALALLDENDAINLVQEASEIISRLAQGSGNVSEQELAELARRFSALGFFIQSLQYNRTSIDEFLRPPSAVEPIETEIDLPDLPALAPDLAILTKSVVHGTSSDGIETFPAFEIETKEVRTERKEIPAPVAAQPPVAKAPVPVEAPKEELDAELLCIFIEEAHDVLASIGKHIGLLRDNPGNQEYLTTIRRGFHTLKGSGRMVGLTDLGEAAWGMEQTLNRWLQFEWPVTPALLSLLAAAQPQFDAWVEQIEAHGIYHRDVAALLADAERLCNGDAPTQGAGAAQAQPPRPQAQPTQPQPLQPQPPQIQPPQPPQPLQPPRPQIQPPQPSQPQPAVRFQPVPPIVPDVEIEEELVASALEEPTLAEPNIFAASGENLSDDARLARAVEPDFTRTQVTPVGMSIDIDETIDIVDLDDIDDVPNASDEKAVPQGISSQFGEPEIEEIIELGWPSEDAVPPPITRAMRTSPPAPSRPEPTPVAPTPPVAPKSIAPTPTPPVAPRSIAPAPTPPVVPKSVAVEPEEPDTLHIGDIEISRALFDLYVAEAHLHIDTLHQDFEHLSINPTLVPSEAALRAAHSCAGISGTARCTPLYHLAKAMEHAQERLRELGHAPTTNELDLLKACADTLESMLTEVISLRMPLEAPELIEQLDRIAHAPAAAPVTEPLNEVIAEAVADVSLASLTETASSVLPSATAASGAALKAVVDEIDDQLLPIFLEEAGELLNGLQMTLRAWASDTGNADHAKLVARQLHTLKGSARMAGAMTLGQQIHLLESWLESALSAGHDVRAVIDEIASALDITEQLVGALTGGPMPDLGPATPQPSPSPAVAPITPAVPESTAVAVPVPATATAAAGDAAPDSEGASASQLRVRAELVDRFINDASEIGVARTRIDGELRHLRRGLLDLTENVIRLRNQLREVEIQADVQMQTRMAQAETKHAEFDPLEMDRYTRLQELTRMMAESVNDVTTVQQNLLRNLDSADLALHSQARMTRELQQALMQVRMVPFDSLAVRLYRIVRQASKELGKRASLDMRGGHIEIDRGVLEHIIAPLEHLLRNSLAHGIETPELRRAKGKPEVGQITLTTRQEGNEIVIELADDGAGLNFERIIQRARERGLIGPREIVDERRLTNLIFVPGFSTAEKVSAVSGRGVGMDVVKAETSAVGGRVDVSSKTGAGTRFSIYLPLTLAVTQALLVRTGNRHYAIPSSMISQVMELKAEPIERMRGEGGIEWFDQYYPYRYLPNLLGNREAQPEIGRYNWVLLLHSGSQTLALHVDAMYGNQEIIVKNAGPQLTRIVGMSGATVLGDGEIVLIINPVAMMSRELMYSSLTMPLGETVAPVPEHEPTVMVVDDSLTVRKITSRMLEREGYHVVLAKDGVDAIEALIETVPDVILSDIEMPRMDGFDLVRNIRADVRLKDVPVIMITSRLADKHRDYAMEIGANHYLGKPYREEELLGLIASYARRG